MIVFVVGVVVAPTLVTRHRVDVHGWVVLLHTTPELTTTATQNIKLNTAALAESHDNEVTVRTPLGVISHLRSSVHRAFVCGRAPPLATIHGPILDVFIATSIWVCLVVQLIANFADCLNNMARIWRRRASREKMVERLAFGGVQLLELWTIFELSANCSRGCCI